MYLEGNVRFLFWSIPFKYFLCWSVTDFCRQTESVPPTEIWLFQQISDYFCHSTHPRDKHSWLVIIFNLKFKYDYFCQILYSSTSCYTNLVDVCPLALTCLCDLQAVLSEYHRYSMFLSWVMAMEKHFGLLWLGPYRCT